MKFKLDENLGSRTASVITDAGHDVQTVSHERLNGADDVRVSLPELEPELPFCVCQVQYR